MNHRIQKFISLLRRHKIDAYLVTDDINIKYLTEFPASESWLFVTPKKVFYITDFRYVLEAQKGLRGIVVERYTASIFETLFKLAQQTKSKTLGLDERHISLAQYKNFKKYCPKGVGLVAKNNLVESLREIKDIKEIKQIRKAIDLNLKAYNFLKGVVKPNITEREVLFKLERYVRDKGANFSFDPIIASGPNSCFPHAKVSDRRIRRGEPVLVDMGMDIDGYKSDLTRMFFLGKITPLIQETFQKVAMAQQAAIKKIRANISAREIDQEARNYLKKNRLAQYFGHSLGHGVGLEIHEGPLISQTNLSILKEGMVFTVEPAIYIPHQFGIRLEEMVLVTHQGCEVLSNSTGSAIPYVLH